LLLFPIGAWAVAGTNSFITDSVSGKQAGVNTTGQLAVSENAATTLIASGTSAVAANGNAFLVLNFNISAYKDIRLIVSQTGAQANRQTVTVIARAGSIQATLDSWTMAATAETRLYQTPGTNLSIIVYNTDTVNPANYTYSLVGRPN
jgi:hypothetical protein